MKYFTFEGWKNEVFEEKLISDYKYYLESIKKLIPDSVNQFIQNHTLHDSEIVNLDYKAKDQRLNVVLDGWDINFENKCVYEIRFSDIESILFVNNADETAVDLNKMGTLGYEEIEYLSTKRIEVRWLFSSGVEILITFKEFAFEVS